MKGIAQKMLEDAVYFSDGYIDDWIKNDEGGFAGEFGDEYRNLAYEAQRLVAKTLDKVKI